MFSELAQSLYEYARNAYNANPARINAAIAAIVVSALAAIGVGLDVNSAVAIVAIVAPILLGGEITRRKVTPHVPDVPEAAEDGDDTLHEEKPS